MLCVSNESSNNNNNNENKITKHVYLSLILHLFFLRENKKQHQISLFCGGPPRKEEAINFLLKFIFSDSYRVVFRIMDRKIFFWEIFIVALSVSEKSLKNLN